jgi:hypothetical protein
MENKTIYAQVLPLNLVHKTWEKIKPFFESSWTDESDECTIDQAKVYVSRGDWIVIVFADEKAEIHGAALIKVYNATNERIAYCLALGGRVIFTQEVFDQFCALVTSMGATKIRCAIKINSNGKEPMARLLRRYGYRELYKTLEVAI